MATPGMEIQSGKGIPGIRIYEKPCRCGSKMMIRACPCFLKKHGWASCARCLNPKCARIIGIEKSRKKRRA